MTIGAMMSLLRLLRLCPPNLSGLRPLATPLLSFSVCHARPHTYLAPIHTYERSPLVAGGPAGTTRVKSNHTMKRRVLRAHANKRCLRILSASNLIQTSSGALSSASSRERGYAVLCDASFLRAVLLSYWQANAPAVWREARRRKLHRAAVTTNAAKSARSSVPPEPSAPPAADKIVEATAASIARLPFGDLPALSPHAFLAALLRDAFHGEGGSPPVSSNAAAAAVSTTPHADAASASKFHCYCLPETVAALHRMRDCATTSAASATTLASPSLPNSSVVDASLVTRQKKSVAGSKPQRSFISLPSTGSPRSAQRCQMTATETWLAASFGDLATMGDGNGGGGGVVHRHVGSSPSSAVFPLIFQEVPAAVVNHLLSRITLIQSEEQQQPRHTVAGNSREASWLGEKASSASLPTRNESKAIGEFMAANDTRLGRRPRESIDAAVDVEASACDLNALRLVSMPLFSDHNCMTYSPQSAAAKRRRRNKNRRAVDGSNDVSESPSLTVGHAPLARSQEAGENNANASLSPSRPFSPRMFFVATQSHDVRRRLAAATPLLRLTTSPDALWIEQRGTAYHYGEDGAEARRQRRGNRAVSSCPSSPAVAAAPYSRIGWRNSELVSSRFSSLSHTPSAPHAAATTTTVVAAAPQLSRADVAFMKHLGTAAEVPLPEKFSHHLHPPQQRASPEPGNGVSSRVPADRKRRRQKGRNPLSMKKKQRREVFRAG
ncbi:conserved hypothetical protein [Leishmania braziliensis MHOM/BR/75/M2904]|uniref:UTP23 sensor motif region domain-containing protein n=2 Tax=Leishmania braziliensis TaxID=5660 RepID=A4H6V9_LEIBR|nr:conserved hypothetical protein [Leishmania braziliensis MHOM/BR/75/M2904]CAJ2468412.1 unnamed protein product [Leishmania braziliensis]CAM37419.1 conserved hypothetical protein [Leishmania braziliensis MHOM/BR/75/M2904]